MMDNFIVLMSLCWDEIMFSLKNVIDDIFGYSMDLDGLGGIIFVGIMGLGVGLSYLFIDYLIGKEWYVLFVMLYIVIDVEGCVGSIVRAGRRG